MHKYLTSIMAGGSKPPRLQLLLLRAMDGDGEEDPSLGGDRDYLFTSCLHLGRVLEEHDAEADTIVKRFRRDAQHKDALTVVRRLLKKYHNHDELPIRKCLAEWRVLRDKLLPMISRFHGDTCVGPRALAKPQQRALAALPTQARAQLPAISPPHPTPTCAATSSTTWARCWCS